jgi:hypothetical protein
MNDSLSTLQIINKQAEKKQEDRERDGKTFSAIFSVMSENQ